MSAVSAAYPVAYAGLLDVAAAAVDESVRVVDGYDVSEDPGDVVMVGVPNLSDSESISAGTYSQQQLTHGPSGAIEETGSINGIVLAWNGDGDALAARVAATSILASIGAAIRANRSLGVADFDLVAQMGTADVAEDKVDGATCAVSFTVNYKALI